MFQNEGPEGHGGNRWAAQGQWLHKTAKWVVEAIRRGVSGENREEPGGEQMVAPPQDWEPGRTTGFKREMPRPSWAHVSVKGCGGVGSFRSLERGLVGLVGFLLLLPRMVPKRRAGFRRRG